MKTFLLNPTTKVSKLIADRNSQDVYSDPGKVYTERNAFGSNVMSVQNGKTYWIGEGFTKDGQFPFIDELDMRTLTKKTCLYSDGEG